MALRYKDSARYRASLRQFLLVVAIMQTPCTLHGASLAEEGTNPAYAQNCASCHGPTLGGSSFGPPLKGSEFRAKWFSAGGNELLGFISEKMPPAGPGSLPAQAYVDIANYVLDKNGLGHVSAPTAAVSNGLPPAGGTAIPKRVDPDLYLVMTEKDYMDSKYQDAMKRRTELARQARPVTDDVLRRPPDGDWLQWRRDYDATGYSPLAQINRDNVGKLRVAWALSLSAGTNEIAPLVRDGILFVNSNGTVEAIDAVEGDILWKFVRPAKPAMSLGAPVSQPKSMAIWDNALFVPTIDNHLIALDFHTGKILWDHLIEKTQGSLEITGAPLIAHGKVIQGMSGCGGTAQPGGCFIVALDARTGNEVWRFNTIARPGKRGGDSWNDAPLSQRFGGSVWTTGSYDPDLNLVYFGTGQTYHIAPLIRPKPRRGGSNDALYTDSTLALNPDTGHLEWFYQHLARDIWDLDWAFEQILMTVNTPKGPVRAVATMGKPGIMDVLEAQTGKYLFSYDVGIQTLVTRIDSKTGVKSVDPAFEPTETLSKKELCPFPVGVRNYQATSYDPVHKRLYVPANSSCTQFRWQPGEETDIYFSGLRPKGSEGNYGELVSVDVESRRSIWEQHRRASQSTAILSSAGGLVFAGARDRWFQASDSETGRILWKVRLNETSTGFPITFAKDGTQYVAIIAGGGGPSDAAWQPTTPELMGSEGATTLWVFNLPEDGQR